MGIFTLLAALFETIWDTAKEKAETRRAKEEKKRYENIDFFNIEKVTLDDIETAYRTETEEEFDIVKSNFLSDLDGWQHYETETVEYEVENGVNYCFTIRYKNGTTIYRKFHESSPLAKRLLEYCKKQTSEFGDIIKEANHVVSEIGNLFYSSGESDYETAFSNFKQMQNLYGLNENCTQEDFEKAAGIKMAALIMSKPKDFNQSLYELMLYLLSTEEDGDILEKTNQDEFSFLQQTDGGIDAFAILPKGKNVDNNIVMRYDQAKIRNGFRKVIVLTTGTNTATISNPGIVIWDLEKICVAYISAFKNIVSEKAKAEKQEIKKERFAVIDFETTGLNSNFRCPPMDEIISVAIIDQDGNTLLNTDCDTINVKTWYKAQQVNGISPRMVKGCPTFVELLPKVLKILSSYDYVIAYNVPFEKSFLENYVHFYTPTDFSFLNVKWGRDPMVMFMDYMGSSRFLKLETAAAHFGYTYRAHNALEDTKATLFIYNALR